ncbi:hypothetical protein NEOLEDRAFT_1149577 [Neolentinus lepideus HHB14362 ss-1]|uniref:Lytic polysaccharide monooxygenase n=1 Tax=Neolentinus lepideus HHB14362 ss-1 TaxID=1314782 RepID=A0A165R044_9AGAM|nr:hypothetical protein NEOLEDRAFT_1149577 [Neolentinus lepideus HHB14362 ss-1]
MKFFVAAVASSLFALATAAATCPEAARFGHFSVEPASFASGDSVTVNADFTCANQLGYAPTYTDYYLEVPSDSNNGHEPPVLLARRQPVLGANTDSFTVQIPYGYYFPNASYSIYLENTHAVNGTNGSPVYQVGSISTGVSVTPSVS